MGWVMAGETRTRHGNPAAFHIHALIAAHKQDIRRDVACAIWADLNRQRSVGGLLILEDYDPSGNGLEYALKTVPIDPDSWQISHNLDRFRSSIAPSLPDRRGM